jgi:sugar phosphate isomerase/epimerase
MKLLIFLLFLLPIAAPAQRVNNQFFALHNIIRGDSVYDTFDEQVALVKGAGFEAIEINSLDHFEGMKAALDQHQFPGAYFYLKVRLEPPYLDPRTEGYLRQLKGSKTIVAPFVVSESKRYAPSSNGADTLAVRLLRQVADWAGESGLQVAIYPHVFFYVERTDHALALARQIDRPNVGLSFNLCHWLATTPAPERAALKTHLKTLRPYLKMMTICGANDVPIPEAASLWKQYILPLGTGTFDTYELIRYGVRDLKFNGPIGVQCYAIQADKPQLIRNTVAVWQEYRKRLEGG